MHQLLKTGAAALPVCSGALLSPPPQHRARVGEAGGDRRLPLLGTVSERPVRGTQSTPAPALCLARIIPPSFTSNLSPCTRGPSPPLSLGSAVLLALQGPSWSAALPHACWPLASPAPAGVPRRHCVNCPQTQPGVSAAREARSGRGSCTLPSNEVAGWEPVLRHDHF